MVRYYPEEDCFFYVEKLVPGAEAPIPIKTRRPAPPRREVSTWGYGDLFESQTGIKGSRFLPCRTRAIKLPTAGQRRLFAIHRTGPVGMLYAPMHSSKVLETRIALGFDRQPEPEIPKKKAGKKKGKRK